MRTCPAEEATARRARGSGCPAPQHADAEAQRLVVRGLRGRLRAALPVEAGRAAGRAGDADRRPAL